MTDTITLPRAVVKRGQTAVRLARKFTGPTLSDELSIFFDALDAALAEPEQKPEPVAWMHRCWSPDCGEFVDFHTVEEMKFIDRTEWTPLYAAPPQPVHPGYIIGSHWLETAYSRIAAGEAEADVLAEVLGERGWVKREPATDEQVAEADESHEPSWLDYRDGWRDAERFHGVRKEDKT
jgi:hypothetical protein